MKNFLQVFIVMLTLQSIGFTQVPVIQTIINQTNLDSLTKFVRELSGEDQTIINGTPYTIVSRRWNHAGNDMAANYIQQKLESYGLPTYNQPFGTGGGRNVYAVQVGTQYPNKKYIICAHYDDFTYSGTVVPGADDNASGTAAVIEAARIFKNYDSKYTIIYALWDEEERGLYGSDYYAQQAYNAGDSIMGVINMDMIAYDSNSDSKAEIHTRPIANSIALKDKMLETNTLYNTGLTLSTINPGATYSDHASFWNRNYGAILLIELDGDFNAYYHTANDRIQYFNMPYFLKMSKLSLGVTAALAELTDIVPVELLAFNASVNGSEVQLIWSTASELNNMGFEIERSIDNQDNFVTIGFVDGKGSSSEINYYSFTDHPQVSGVNQLYYRLKQVDFDGSFSYSDVVNVSYDVPAEFVLSQNYPNPFNPSTKINYFVPQESFVSVKVYDFLGREVMTLVNETRAVGSYEIVFDASSLPSGTYFYTLIGENYSFTKKMILIK
ncbi:MAG: M28 family peptidase [Ignavibacteriaceae bacterium]|nr:M28 family peptidase [Ignavibacteriaceae bacterium]